MGSKLGWLLAGALALLVLGAALWMLFFPGRSSPTKATAAKGVLDLQKTNVSIATVLGAEPSGAGNAGEDYRKAIQLYRLNRKAIEEYTRQQDEAPKAQPPAKTLEVLKQIDAHVAAGADKARMTYALSLTTSKRLQANFFYMPAYDFEDISATLDALLNCHYHNGQFDKALAVLTHSLVLGWHMAEERAILHSVHSCLGIQIRSLNGMRDVYRAGGGASKEKLASIQEYLSAVKTLRDAYDRKAEVLWTPRPHAGDVLNLAEHDQDRACRVQAIVTLGMLRFSAARRSDRRYAMALIERYAAASDPLDVAAAKTARDMAQDDVKNFATQGRRQ